MPPAPFQIYSNSERSFWRFYSDCRLFSCRLINEAREILGRLIAWHDSKQAVVLTDVGISGCDWFNELLLDLPVSVHQLHSTASQENMTDVIERLRHQGCDLILSIGGGTVLDAAKLVTAVLATPHSLNDLLSLEQLPHPRVPLVAVPTTFGTGSETDMISHLHLDGQKLGMRRTWLTPSAALLVAEIAVQAPWHLRFLSAVDAWSHSLEALTLCYENSPVQVALLGQALQLHIVSLADYLENPDLNNAADIATAATLAGLGLNNGRTGLPHAMAEPVSAYYGLAHPESLLPFLPTVTAQLHTVAAERTGNLGPSVGQLDRLFAKTIAPNIHNITQNWQIQISNETLMQFAQDCLKDQVAIKESPISVDQSSCLSMYRESLAAWLTS